VSGLDEALAAYIRGHHDVAAPPPFRLPSDDVPRSAPDVSGRSGGAAAAAAAAERTRPSDLAVHVMTPQPSMPSDSGSDEDSSPSTARGDPANGTQPPPPNNASVSVVPCAHAQCPYLPHALHSAFSLRSSASTAAY
jgi:hypothetical protein